MNDIAPRTVYAVSEFAEMLRALVEDSLPRVWVEGEISNFSRPASGHWYFTLKDAQAQVRCAMFRNANYLVAAQPRNGDRVRVRAQVSYYTARGDLQLICEFLEPAGEGALLQAFEALKRRLAAEGVFDTALKRALPPWVRRLGVITSATGAALQDVLAALSRRFALMPVTLWPVPVQGAAAAPAIVAALQNLPRRAQVDAILLVRGGGSLEDLWAFNEERVARAIRACAVPVVTGIGHEIDFTIADLAADLRAPTPTAAAELVSPDGPRLRARLDERAHILQRSLRAQLGIAAQRLTRAQERLRHAHPQRALLQRAQRLDDYGADLLHAWDARLACARERLSQLQSRLGRCAPAAQMERHAQHVATLRSRLVHGMRAALALRAARWQQQHGALIALSPQAVLERGYAIARTPQGRVLREAEALAPQGEFELILARGRLRARRQD